jgi:hypothetical protein
MLHNIPTSWAVMLVHVDRLRVYWTGLGRWDFAVSTTSQCNQSDGAERHFLVWYSDPDTPEQERSCWYVVDLARQMKTQPERTLLTFVENTHS